MTDSATAAKQSCLLLPLLLPHQTDWHLAVWSLGLGVLSLAAGSQADDHVPQYHTGLPKEAASLWAQEETVQPAFNDISAHDYKGVLSQREPVYVLPKSRSKSKMQCDVPCYSSEKFKASGARTCTAPCCVEPAAGGAARAPAGYRLACVPSLDLGGAHFVCCQFRSAS